MKDFKLTLTGLIVAVSILLITLILEIELFEAIIEALEDLEHLEIDEIIIPAIVFLLFALLDQLQRRRKHEVEIERVKIYRAMLSSTHHILNNFLNQMTLFKLTADKTPEFDHKILRLYDEVIKDAKVQIDALGSVQDINEITITRSVSPKNKELSERN